MAAPMLGVPGQIIAVGVDGCGIPAIATPLSTAARFFADSPRRNDLPELA